MRAYNTPVTRLVFFLSVASFFSSDTFERVAQMSAAGEAEVRVEMSFLEIYIENVYDLLAAADAVSERFLFVF